MAHRRMASITGSISSRECSSMNLIRVALFKCDTPDDDFVGVFNDSACTGVWRTRLIEQQSPEDFGIPRPILFAASCKIADNLNLRCPIENGRPVRKRVAPWRRPLPVHN